VVQHFATLPEQEIGRTLSRAQAESLLREPPPESGRDFLEVLAEFAEKVVPNSFRINHPRFLAFVPSAPVFPAVLGDLLCAGTNFFAGVWLESAGPAQVELLVLDWFKEFLGYPAKARGILTGGGSEANLTALVVARERLDRAERPRAVGRDQSPDGRVGEARWVDRQPLVRFGERRREPVERTSRLDGDGHVMFVDEKIVIRR
jgi:glutamate/tyrosine decarboxylase-like PLP-dependent enzyme